MIWNNARAIAGEEQRAALPIMRPAAVLKLPCAALGWGGFILLHAHAASAVYALPFLLFGLALAALGNQIDFSRRPSRLELALLALGLVWLLVALSGLDPRRSLSLSVPALVALVCAIAMPRAGRQQPRAAYQVTVWALSALGLWGCGAVLGALPFASPEHIVSKFWVPWLVVPNDLAWIGCLWPWWWRACRERPERRLRWPALAAASLVLLGALLLLQSRLGLLVLALAVGLEIGRGSKGLRWSAATVAALGLFALLAPGLMDKGLASGGARLQLWQAAWGLFIDYPLLGAGPHSFIAAFPELASRADLIDPRASPWPHSLPLEILCSGGLALTLASVMLIALRLRAPGGLPPRAVWVSFLLVCLLEASTLRIWFWFWFVLLMLPPFVRREQAR